MFLRPRLLKWPLSMLPFSIQLKRGAPAHEQIIAAMRDALASGQLRDGDPFPSIRDLTQSLRISPRTAQKAVDQLKETGFLATHRGSGFIIRVQSEQSLATFDAESALPTMIEPVPLSASGGDLV